MNLIPPDDRVILRPLPAESRTAFGLEIPEIAQEAPLRAVVLAVGRGEEVTLADGDRIRWSLGLHNRIADGGLLTSLEPGDEVILPRYGGTNIETEDGETVISILAHEILAVVG